MTRIVQNRRGTTAEHAGFAGAEGEVTIDTDKYTAVVHDGETLGGHPLAKFSDLPDVSDKVIGDGIVTIKKIFQRDYDLLNPPDPDTLYVIVPFSVTLESGLYSQSGYAVTLTI